MTKKRHKERFLQDWPIDLLRDFTAGIFECYLKSGEFCSTEWDKPEGANLLPWLRRQMVERMLKNRANSYSKRGVQVLTEKDPGFWYHNVIRVGGSMLTQSRVCHPEEIVRSSHARLSYSEANDQKLLAEDWILPPESTEGYVYGILLHGNTGKDKFFPSFAQVVFPKRNLSAYRVARIDLFKEFPEVIRQCTSGQFEERHSVVERHFEEISLPEPELRTDIGVADKCESERRIS